MNQTLAIILGIVFFLTLARLYIARNSREIHQNNVFQANFLQKKEMAEIENTFVKKNTWTMNVCAFVLIGIGTLMFVAFFNEEERPARQDSVVTHP